MKVPACAKGFFSALLFIIVTRVALLNAAEHRPEHQITAIGCEVFYEFDGTYKLSKFDFGTPSGHKPKIRFTCEPTSQIVKPGPFVYKFDGVTYRTFHYLSIKLDADAVKLFKEDNYFPEAAIIDHLNDETSEKLKLEPEPGFVDDLKTHIGHLFERIRGQKDDLSSLVFVVALSDAQGCSLDSLSYILQEFSSENAWPATYLFDESSRRFERTEDPQLTRHDFFFVCFDTIFARCQATMKQISPNGASGMPQLSSGCEKTYKTMFCFELKRLDLDPHAPVGANPTQHGYSTFIADEIVSPESSRFHFTPRISLIYSPNAVSGPAATSCTPFLNLTLDKDAISFFKKMKGSEPEMRYGPKEFCDLLTDKVLQGFESCAGFKKELEEQLKKAFDVIYGDDLTTLVISLGFEPNSYGCFGYKNLGSEMLDFTAGAVPAPHRVSSELKIEMTILSMIFLASVGYLVSYYGFTAADPTDKLRDSTISPSIGGDIDGDNGALSVGKQQSAVAPHGRNDAGQETARSSTNLAGCSPSVSMMENLPVFGLIAAICGSLLG